VSVAQEVQLQSLTIPALILDDWVVIHRHKHKFYFCKDVKTAVNELHLVTNNDSN